MTLRIQQKKNYKLYFTTSSSDERDFVWINTELERLKQNLSIMEHFCSATTMLYITATHNNSKTYTVYYSEEANELLEKFIFKLKLKNPNVLINYGQTMKEFS